MYYLLGVCLTLAALLAVNFLASLMAAVLWRGVARYAYRWSSVVSARSLFTLRIFPATCALVCVVAFFVPAYVAYEPWSTGEVVSTKLVAPALISAIGIMLAFWRGTLSWRATQRLLADWMSYAEAISIKGIFVPAYRFRHPYPVVAVVGVLRPRLFIADCIFDSLSDDEIAAAVAHEAGHLIAHDNLKRVLLRSCRDLLAVLPCGRSLDRAWVEAAEAAADEHAARAGAPVALDLATALIKIARMVPEGTRPIMPAGSFIVGDDTGGIAWRVRRLIQLAETGYMQRDYNPLILSTTCAGLCAFLAALVYIATSSSVLATLHAVIEQIVLILN